MKKTHLSLPDSFQLDRLKKYYELDETTNTFIITLTYNSVHELFDEQLSTTKPVVKNEVLDKIHQILGDIPKGYNADFRLVIKDYDDYDPEQVLDSFNDLVKIYHYRYRLESQSRYSKIAFLLISGMFFALLLVLGGIKGWFDKETKIWDALVVISLDVLSYVLIWESICHAAIHRPQETNYKYISSGKFSSLMLCRENKNDIVTKENVFEHVNASKNPIMERILSFLLLIGSIGFILVALFSGSSSLINFLDAMRGGHVTNAALRLILIIGENVLLIFLGQLMYRLYLGHNRYLIITGIVGFLAVALGINDYFGIYQLEGWDVGNILALIVDSLIYLDFIVAYIFACIYFKQFKNRDTQN